MQRMDDLGALGAVGPPIAPWVALAGAPTAGGGLSDRPSIILVVGNKTLTPGKVRPGGNCEYTPP